MLNLCISYSEVIQQLFRIYSEFFHIFSEFSLMVFFKVVTTFANLRSKNSLFYMLAVEIFFVRFMIFPSIRFRTFVDESGFLVTKKEYASCSEEDEPPKTSPPKKSQITEPSKASSTTVSSPTKANTKQSSIKNFFTRK